MPARCPECEIVLTAAELQAGVCPVCRKAVTGGLPASSSASRTAAFDDYQAEPQPRLGTAQPPYRTPAVALFVVMLLTFLIPGALISSVWLALRKGHSICGAAGCTNASTQQISYSRGIQVGYCATHASAPAHSISSKQRQFPMVLAILAVMMVGYVAYKLKDVAVASAYELARSSPEEERARFQNFVLLVLAVVLLGNAGFWVAARFLC